MNKAITYPTKRPYISPKIELEEMEEDMMNNATGTIEGGNIEGDGNNDDIPEAKRSTFIWDEGYEFTLD